MWIQIVIVLLLLAIGSFLLFKKKSEATFIKNNLTISKYATGFFLGILNPPVLIYWIVAFGIINNNDIMLSLKSSLAVLFLFLL